MITPAHGDNANNTGLAIETVGLTKRFGRTLAVDSLSLQIPRGSTFGLIGPNGAGKSTTIKMLMGMLSDHRRRSPRAGHRRGGRFGAGQAAGRLCARDASHLPLDAGARSLRLLQVVLPHVERPDLPGNGRTVRPRPGKEGQASLEGHAGQAGAGCWPSRTSRNCCCWTSRSRAWTRIAREEFLDGVLRTICDRGQTVLISSHMLDDVRRLADTVGILNEGRLLLQGNLDALLTSTKRISATLRDGCRPEQTPDGVDLAARPGPRVDDHGARLHAGKARSRSGRSTAWSTPA